MGCHKRGSRRAGSATVELAVCLPTLIFIFLAAVQAADTIFLKQTLHLASYESIRVAIQRRSSNDLAVASGTQLLTSRGVSDYDITFDPTNVGDAPRGQMISVAVSAPAGANTVLPVWFFGSQDLTVTAKMVKE